jgi:hypothetical protein
MLTSLTKRPLQTQLPPLHGETFFYYIYWFICYTRHGLSSGRGNRLQSEHKGQILVIFRTTGMVHDILHPVISRQGAFSLIKLSEQNIVVLYRVADKKIIVTDIIKSS